MTHGQPTSIALALVRRDGLWLVSRRRTDDAFGGLWEFPGGKMQPGESAARAAVRECTEEVAAVVEPVRELSLIEHGYGPLIVRLHPVLCRLVRGEPAPNSPAVAEVRWVNDQQLAALHMPAANQPLRHALRLLDQ